MSDLPLILLTNDDGIASPGLAATCIALAPLGELLILAPAQQQTSMGRSRSQNDQTNGILTPYTVTYEDQNWPGYAANATPALAVEHAVQQLATRPISLAVSGINYGENIGTCVTVSGTIGAALEAAECNIPALAVSLELEQATYHEYTSVDFTAAIHFTQLFAKAMLQSSLPEDVDILKVEIPVTATPNTQWQVTSQDRLAYYQPYFEDQRDLFLIPHKLKHLPLRGQYTHAGTDAHALANGLVSVTPLSLDLTSRTSLKSLEKILLTGLA